MPDHVVILFMFGVLAGFGIVWFANELRSRYQARYLEYNFYFLLSSVCYGFANWIAPFAILYVMDADGGADPFWFIAVFVLLAVPVLLLKLFFLYLLFQELLARERPPWFNKLSLAFSFTVLLLTAWSVKLINNEINIERIQNVIIGFGVLVVVIEFAIIFHYMASIRRISSRVIGEYSISYGLLFLGGYGVYVFAAYSQMLLPGSSLVQLTPYIYFIIHGLPLIVLWLFHQNEPAAVINTNATNIGKFIETHALTAKEADILKQIIHGASNREIAEQFCISPHTVRNHIYNIYNKTGIRNRFQLLAVCQEDDNA